MIAVFAVDFLEVFSRLKDDLLGLVVVLDAKHLFVLRVVAQFGPLFEFLEVRWG